MPRQTFTFPRPFLPRPAPSAASVGVHVQGMLSGPPPEHPDSPPPPDALKITVFHKAFREVHCLPPVILTDFPFLLAPSKQFSLCLCTHIHIMSFAHHFQHPFSILLTDCPPSLLHPQNNLSPYISLLSKFPMGTLCPLHVNFPQGLVWVPSVPPSLKIYHTILLDRCLL